MEDLSDESMRKVMREVRESYYRLYGKFPDERTFRALYLFQLYVEWIKELEMRIKVLEQKLGL